MIDLPTEANPIRILVGDCVEILKTLPDKFVRCCVTSPPYWGLRDYGIPGSVWDADESCEHEWGNAIVTNSTNHVGKARWNHAVNGRGEEQPAEKRVGMLRPSIEQGQFCQKCGAWFGVLGLEPTPELFVQHIVVVFREVRRVLTDDGTLWLNLGDSYSALAGQRKAMDCAGTMQRSNAGSISTASRCAPGLKPKDLVGIPWMCAFALRADGWWLRQDIIWSKSNCMPESVGDRCTKSHEYVFLMSKSARYHFDSEAISEPCLFADEAKYDNGENGLHSGVSHAGSGSSTRKFKSGNKARKPASARGVPVDTDGDTNGAVAGSIPWEGITRIKRSVWPIAIRPLREAHFATFPEKLVEPCILAGSAEGDIILDPFGGAGTVGVVAGKKWRRAILIELNPEYAKIAENRIAESQGSGLISWEQASSGNGSLPVVPGRVLQGAVQQLWPDDAEADSHSGSGGELPGVERPEPVDLPVEADQGEESQLPADDD